MLKKRKRSKEKYEEAKVLTELAEKSWDELKGFDANNKRRTKRQEALVDGLKETIKGLKDARRDLIPKFGIDILGYAFADKTSQLIKAAGDEGYPSTYHKKIINDSLADEECKLCERSFKNDKKIKFT